MQLNAVVNMAENGVLVTISGPALSLLLYENARSNGDQIGLLLGNVLTFVTKKVTDCERHVEKTEYHINIDTITVCSKDIIKDGTGRINPAKLESFIKNKEKRVVGWFRFRRHSFLQPTMKDKILHKELETHFWNLTRAREEHFIMFLLNASATKHFGTHKYRHVCLQHFRDSYRPVALRINNLGHDISCLDGSDYKSVPERRFQETNCFTKLVEDLKLNPDNTSSVDMVTNIEKQSENYLHRIISMVCESDEEISKLQHKVNEMRAKLLKVNWQNSCSQTEKASQLQHSIESEKILTTAQVHGSPRSTHSEDLFDTDPSSPVPSSNSPYLNSHIKKTNVERTKQSMVSKENRNHASTESSYSEIRTDNSPENTRSRERVSKLPNKSGVDEKFATSKRQTSSPRNTGKKSERHSFGDFGSHSQDDTKPFANRDQTP